jgi:hypothetical protein
VNAPALRGIRRDRVDNFRDRAYEKRAPDYATVATAVGAKAPR